MERIDIVIISEEFCIDLEDVEMNDFYAEFVLVYVWSEWVGYIVY